MTTFELTWQYSLNAAYTPSSAADLGQYAFFNLKALAMGNLTLKDATQTPIGSPSGLWTCQGSSNGTTGAMDAVDRIGTTYTPANLVAAANTSAHSWIVLKNTTTGLYMLLSFVGANYQWHIGCSFTAYSGGSATTDPTSSNEFTPQVGAAGYQKNPNTMTNHHFHGWLSTQGELMWASSRDGSGFINSCLFVRSLAETHTGDAANSHLYTEFNDTSGCLKRNGGALTANNGIQAPGWQGRSATPATAAVALTVLDPYQLASSLLEDMPSVDPIDGKVEDQAMRLYVYTASHKSIRGRCQDIAWSPTAAGYGVVEPSAGPPFASTVLGNVFLPWQGMTVAPTL